MLKKQSLPAGIVFKALDDYKPFGGKSINNIVGVRQRFRIDAVAVAVSKQEPLFQLQRLTAAKVRSAGCVIAI